MPNIEAINAELQRRLKQDGLATVTAVTAARWLEQAGLLRDSLQRPGKPLRNLLRAGRILGQRQESNGWWFIDRLNAQALPKPVGPAPSTPPGVAPLPHPSPAANSGGAWYETLRQQYKPDKLKTLLVAESPPDPGGGERRFFYAPDLHRHDNLYRGVAEALYGEEPNFNVDTKVKILRRIQADGFWLIDAVEQPVNHLPDAEKSKLIREGTPQLVRRCLKLAPERGVILCHGGVYDIVSAKLRSAGVILLHDSLIPFPMPFHLARFVAEFRRALTPG